MASRFSIASSPTISRSKLKVDFYHLVASPVDRVLPQICERLLSIGEHLLVVCEPSQIAELDRLLWNYRRDSFLPHGIAGASRANEQPILFSDSIEAENGASNVALVDGRWRDEALGFARAFFFFGTETVDEARAAWRAVKARADVEPRYWRQSESGKWEQAA